MKRNTVYGILIGVLLLGYALRFAGVFSLGSIGDLTLPTEARIEAQKAEIVKKQAKLDELYKTQRERGDARLALVDKTTPFWKTEGDKLPTTDVQSQIERIGQRIGMPLNKMGAPRLVEISDDVTAIEIQISSATTIKRLAEFAAEVENHTPMLTWDYCNIRPNRTQNPDAVMVSGKIRAYVLSDRARAYMKGDPMPVATKEGKK